MAALQTITQSSVSTGATSYNSCKGAASTSASAFEKVVPDQFPAGLRVLVVDDDITTLRVLEQMSRKCHYDVTTCSEATVALNLLRERKGCFDVVLSDVHMPDMDGYNLLEHVGLEMDLPVIMMSADGRTSAVMRGIRHGACDYLIKPVREEELRNIWQHVVRKKCNENKEHENSGSLEDYDQHKRGNDDCEYASSVNDATEGILRTPKKRSNSKEEDDGEMENEDPSTSKKPRVVWSVELHQQFVSAVNQLGLDKAVPKRILELMNVPGLTRENVASHLQKFRLYLKRISGVAQQHNGISNTLSGSVESNVKLGALGRFNIQALAASGQIPPETLAALHAELLGHPADNLAPAVDQPALLQASLQGPKHTPIQNGVAFGQPLVKCASDITKHFPQSILSVEDVPSGYGAWPSNRIGSVGPNNNLGNASPQNCNMLMDILQQQHQKQQQPQQQHQMQQQAIISEHNRLINVQPSCLVVPSQSSSSFHAGNSPASVNQNCRFNRSPLIDYSLVSPQSKISPLNIGQFPDGDSRSQGVLSGYTALASISPASSSSVNAEHSSSQQIQNSTTTFGAGRNCPVLVPNTCNIPVSHGAKSGEILEQGLFRNFGFVGKGTCIPSRFAVDEIDSPLSNMRHGNICVDNNGKTVKQEPYMDYMDNQKVGIPILQRFSSSDITRVFTK